MSDKTTNYLILESKVEDFKRTVNIHTEAGWKVVPGTVLIKETRSGRQWFSCVVEKPEAKLPAPPDFEEPKLDEMMIDLAAASEAPYIQLQYANHVWSVLSGHKNTMAVIPDSISDDPYKAVAAAIEVVTILRRNA